MPTFFQVLAKLVPANYVIQIMRGIILRGTTVADLWQPIAWLTAYAVIIIVVLAVMRFKKTAA